MIQTGNLAHIGIAVNCLECTIPFYTNALNFTLEKVEIVKSQSVKVALLRKDYLKIELLEPIDKSSKLIHFLKKRGEGLHHIALEVYSIEQKMVTLQKLNVPLLYDKPEKGANGARINFIHPKATNGVLFELYQSK